MKYIKNLLSIGLLLVVTGCSTYRMSHTYPGGDYIEAKGRIFDVGHDRAPVTIIKELGEQLKAWDDMLEPKFTFGGGIATYREDYSDDKSILLQVEYTTKDEDGAVNQYIQYNSDEKKELLNYTPSIESINAKVEALVEIIEEPKKNLPIFHPDYIKPEASP